GKFPAGLPGELLYARNHMWCRADGRRCHFGFTSYAVRLMQDVYFLEWHLSDGAAVQQLEQIGNIETSKAESALYAPLAGTMPACNKALVTVRSGSNVDGYGEGWRFEMHAAPSSLLSAGRYHQCLNAGGEKTQRYIKGKINTGD